MNKRHIKIKPGFLFALPAAVYMLIFVGYPMIQNFILSFKNVDVYTFADKTKQSFVGFKNYADLFAGEGSHSAVCNYKYAGIYRGIDIFPVLYRFRTGAPFQ